MTQERIENTEDGSRRSETTGYQAPDIENTLSKLSSEMKKVRVVHGANEQYFDNLEGKTVGNVRKSLREVFNIPSDAEALINGKPVGDDFVLEGSNVLEFSKNSGIKG